jgi:MoaA/NifB/PqqE/SkfB family radical SAM enzyme
MSADLFARICDHLPPLTRLTLHGIGEPTLNPEYPQIVTLAGQSGKFKTICANSHALSRDARYYQGLFDAGLTELYVSVDSLTQEVASRVRTGTRVDLLQRRLAEFAALKLPVSVTLVASRFNLSDIAETLTTLNTIGAFTVCIQEYVDLGRPEGCLTRSDRAALGSLMDEHRARWSNLQLKGTLSIGKTWTPDAICSDPWLGMGITVDGYLTPCCMMWDPATLGYLNLGTRSLADALQSAEYRSFADRFMIAAPDFCDGCQKNSRPVAQPLIHLLRHPAERELAQAV